MMGLNDNSAELIISNYCAMGDDVGHYITPNRYIGNINHTLKTRLPGASIGNLYPHESFDVSKNEWKRNINILTVNPYINLSNDARRNCSELSCNWK